MGLIKHLKLFQRKESDALNEIIRTRLIEWRKEATPSRIEHPTNLISARRLGYKAKHGFVLVRVRLSRGQKQRPSIRHGRRSAHMRQRLVLQKSYQRIAEERVNRAYPNLEVLNSYKVGKDGLHYWYEIILVDPQSPEIKADKDISWITSGKHKNRAARGLTSAGDRSRGLKGKGKGHEKMRPSKTAAYRRKAKQRYTKYY
ncbi:MAG TPA: 50S ribosomal protein L15e [Candidatus Nanoarchaeia archaeon]|nr:50S ribosomal protein L15e [Candidatus Nanoarchaeia archaeon]